MLLISLLVNYPRALASHGYLPTMPRGVKKNRDQKIELYTQV